MTTDTTLYHYTTQEGFLGIVKDGAIRASSIQHLNDASEFHYASNILLTVLNETTQDKEITERIWAIVSSAQYSWDTFVASFSADGDQLGQWRAYGQSGGFSIGFNLDALREVATKQGYVLEKCSYDAERNKAQIKPVVEWAVHQNPFEPGDSFKLLFMFLNVAPKFKHPSFKAEEEWRLIKIRQAPFMSTATCSDIFYRKGKSFFVPYLNFALTDSENSESLLPIDKVFVGPTPHPDLSVWTVRNCLKTKGLIMNGDKVEKSAIPYRDW